jgi:hypothetical protein
MDVGRSPHRILVNHSEDQFLNFLRDSSPPRWLSKSENQPPVQTETCQMPANHCLRRNDDQSFFPAGPEPVGNDPKEFV